MKESRTTYSYLIEHMQEPSFQKIWDIAFDFVRKLPSDLCDELHESLNRGFDVLDSEPLLQMYIYAFGKMHNAKLQYAFEHLQKNVIKYREIEIVDYGCGQGLATICYHDFLQGHNIEQMVKRITLIEPSTMALSRAELLCSRFYPDAEIIAINKQFDDLTNEDLSLSPYIPTIHLLSNILDVDSYDLQHFSRIVKEQSVSDNEYVLVSPMQNTMRIKRLKDFVINIEKYTYFEQYLDKRQLDSDKDWTCAVLLCSQSNIIEYDCDEVFEEARIVAENKENVLNEEYRSELFHKLQVCARYGDKRCQNMLGIWYEKGIGTHQNYELAIEWYKKSAEQEYASAYGNLGDLYNYGEGVTQDFSKAVEYYTLGANLNSADCLYDLACCYFSGEGVKEDKEKAFSLFERAASLDEPFAKYELYRCYINGWGTEKDETSAIKVLKEAVKLKHPESCYILARYFHSGNLVQKNDQKALKLIKESAELGYCMAQEKLGEIYRRGALDEEESPKKSFKWYYKAAEQGNASAQFYVGYYYASGYGVKKDVNLAFEWYSRAAEQNNSSALNNLAICYKYGKGTSTDLTKAVHYYEEAAKLGNTTAQKNLAICYKNGIGVNIDPSKAFFWTMEAAKLLDKTAQGIISFYYLKGYGTSKSNEESLLWYARYYFSKSDINDSYQAFETFAEKANDNDAQALYIVGKCLQYGVVTNKNISDAFSYFEKAADLGHVESLIKLRRQSSLSVFCSKLEDKSSIKDTYGAVYSKDKKILISAGYIGSKDYKIADGTRIICDNAFHSGSIGKIVIPSSVMMIGNNPFAKTGHGKCDINCIECHSCNFIVSDFALYTHDKKKLISYFGKESKITIPDGVEIIGENAFYDSECVEKVAFPDSLSSIMDGAFMYCKKLKSIVLSDNTICIGARCFYGCESLTDILSLGKVTNIKEDTFNGCNITKLILPTTLVQIEDNAFNSNHNLKNVSLPINVKRLGNSCFAYCAIANINLNDNLLEIGDFCFFNCPIDEIIVPPQVIKIGINPFVGTKHVICLGIGKYESDNGLLYDKESGDVIAHYGDTEIALYPPICRIKSFAFCNSNVTDIFMGANIIEVAPWAFYNAEELEKIIWQKSKNVEISEGCFGNCKSLNKITIPASVVEIHKGSFFGCSDLKMIRFEGEKTKANERIFERIDMSSILPTDYWPQDEFMGSTIGILIERENLNFNSFAKIEIIIPHGCSKNYKFDTIYDKYDNYDMSEYGMDRTFVLMEDEKK